ncbi:hypothetical protein GW931_02785 [archaeon]|nr:hypothetical protein [archaeon]
MKTFDKLVVGSAFLLILYATVFAGVFVMSAMLVAAGLVFSVAILMHKFSIVRRMVVRFSKWFDLLAFAIAFLVASSTFGYIVATFAGVLTSAFLSLYVKFQSHDNYSVNKN